LLQTHETEMKYIGERLQMARKTARYKQKDAAAALEVSEKTISGWENGSTRISMGNMFAVAKLYGQPLAYFFPGTLSDGSPSESDDLRAEIGMLISRLGEGRLKMTLDIIKVIAAYDDDDASGALNVLTDVGTTNDE